MKDNPGSDSATSPPEPPILDEIAKRLGCYSGGRWTREILYRASDEIERLQKERDAWKAVAAHMQELACYGSICSARTGHELLEAAKAAEEEK